MQAPGEAAILSLFGEGGGDIGADLFGEQPRIANFSVAGGADIGETLLVAVVARDYSRGAFGDRYAAL